MAAAGEATANCFLLIMSLVSPYHISLTRCRLETKIITSWRTWNTHWTNSLGQRVSQIIIYYRVIQPKCETPEPTYLLHTWANPETIWCGKSHNMLV